MKSLNGKLFWSFLWLAFGSNIQQVFKVFDKDLIKVGHWKNSSLEILENPKMNTESSKIDLMGAQIRISAVNVSLW